MNDVVFDHHAVDELGQVGAALRQLDTFGTAGQFKPLDDKITNPITKYYRFAGVSSHNVRGAWAIGPATLHPLVLLFALSGTLMISKTLRIPKF